MVLFLNMQNLHFMLKSCLILNSWNYYYYISPPLLHMLLYWGTHCLYEKSQPFDHNTIIVIYFSLSFLLIGSYLLSFWGFLASSGYFILPSSSVISYFCLTFHGKTFRELSPIIFLAGGNFAAYFSLLSLAKVFTKCHIIFSVTGTKRLPRSATYFEFFLPVAQWRGLTSKLLNLPPFPFCLISHRGTFRLLLPPVLFSWQVEMLPRAFRTCLWPRSWRNVISFFFFRDKASAPLGHILWVSTFLLPVKEPFMGKVLLLLIAH